MRRTVRATLLLASLLTLCGCVQSKLDIYLNPDGTGKVVYEVLRGAPEDEFADWFSERDKENLARQSARDILQESKGVAAWRDVSTGFTKEKQFRFKGTAYFRSLNLLALRLSQFTLTQTRGQVLGMRVTAAFAEGKQERDPLFDDVGDDEEEKENLRVEDLMKKYRADYLQRRVFLAATLNVLQSNLTLHLPAAGAADGFKKQDERTFTCWTRSTRSGLSGLSRA